MQDLSSILYGLNMHLENGVRGRIVIRWTENGELFARILGAAVHYIDRQRH